MADITFTLTLTNLQGSVAPPMVDVPRGRHQIIWKLPAGSQLEFADPPVTFFGPLPLPFTNNTIPGGSPTYTDDNSNNTGQDQYYYYQLRLIAGNILIIWPANEVARGPTPIIRNRPT
jgi:hypothetical protein